MQCDDRRQIDLGQDVPVEHHDRLAKRIPGIPHRPRRAQRFALDDMTDAHAPPAAVAEMALDDIGAVVNEEQEVREAVTRRQFHLVFQQWLARDRHHRFWQIAESFAQPGPGSARENDCLPAHAGEVPDPDILRVS